MKQGQIAHVDHNSENSKEDNLAFLCLDCHDIYDSKTSQSKNITIGELKHYRAELYRDVECLLDRRSESERSMINLKNQKVTEGDMSVAGRYIRISLGDSAEICLTPVPMGTKRYHVSGLALWGKDHQRGPNIGELDFTSELDNSRLEHNAPNRDDTYYIVLHFNDDLLEVVEDNYHGRYGMNVTFNGLYKRA